MGKVIGMHLQAKWPPMSEHFVCGRNCFYKVDFFENIIVQIKKYGYKTSKDILGEVDRNRSTTTTGEERRTA